MKNTKRKLLPIITLLFSILMLLLMVILAILNAQNIVRLPSNLDAHIIDIFCWLVAIIAVLFLKKFIPIYFTFIYSIFLFFSHFLGNILQFYKLQFLHIGLWWDKLLHTSFGYLICFIALYILCRLAEIDKLKNRLILLFIIGFSLATAVFWEIIEFTSDSLFHTIAQGEHIPLPNGSYVIAVTDTMFDLIVHTCGSILFVVQYILHAATKKSFLIGHLKIIYSKKD